MHDLEEYVILLRKLEKLYAKKAKVMVDIDPLERRTEEIRKAWGNSGRTFKLKNGVIVQAAQPGNYCSLTVIKLEEVK